MTSQMLIGYRVKKTNFVNSFGERVEYILTGKRGAQYQLIRNQYRGGGFAPDFFVRNSEGNIVGLKGNYTIKESWMAGR
ncbi:MAG: hypothetical protein ABIH23_20160 [bacterium]